MMFTAAPTTDTGYPIRKQPDSRIVRGVGSVGVEHSASRIDTTVISPISVTVSDLFLSVGDNW